MSAHKRPGEAVDARRGENSCSAHDASPWASQRHAPDLFFRGRQDDDGRPSPLVPLLVIIGIPVGLFVWGAIIWTGWRLFQ